MENVVFLQHRRLLRSSDLWGTSALMVCTPRCSYELGWCWCLEFLQLQWRMAALWPVNSELRLCWLDAPPGPQQRVLLAHVVEQKSGERSPMAAGKKHTVPPIRTLCRISCTEATG